MGAQGRKAVGISVGRENVTEFVLVSLPCVQLPAYIDSSYQRGRALRIRIQTRGYEVHKIHVSKVLRDFTQTRHSINGISVRSASHLIIQQGSVTDGMCLNIAGHLSSAVPLSSLYWKICKPSEYPRSMSQNGVSNIFVFICIHRHSVIKQLATQ